MPTSSKALALPDEVWLLVASNLAYRSLKSLGRVCKRFNKLLEDKSLDRAVFRTKADKKKLPPSAQVELHPMLRAIEWADVDRPMQIFRLRRDEEDDSFEQLFDPYSLAAIDEFATSPACSKISLPILPEFEKDVHVIQAGGVTIRSLFKKMEALWDKTANGVACCEAGTSYGKGHSYGSLWASAAYGLDGKVWSEPKVGKDGAITLVPYFASWLLPTGATIHGQHNAFDFAAADEYATMPACNSIEYDVG
ncbi:hypothetical protein JCM3770_005823 [Rhodotorula araucariae]